jgi:hypothetical protein
MAGPFAARMKGIVEEEAKYLEVIRAVLIPHRSSPGSAGEALEV